MYGGVMDEALPITAAGVIGSLAVGPPGRECLAITDHGSTAVIVNPRS